MTRVHASAPTRLDFAGAWTDVPPFATEVGGTVVNAAIELRANAEVILGGPGYRLQSDDLQAHRHAASVAELDPDGRLDLLSTALRLTDPGPCALRTWSDAPPGSGLGSSGALDVALVAALDAARGMHRAPSAIAEAGFHLEAIEAGHAGGRQDQYAAALGGFHRLDFSAGPVLITPIRLPGSFAEQLASHMIVCYTGQSRVSGATIARVMAAYARGDRTVTAALHALVGIAARMDEALTVGDLEGVGGLLAANWEQQLRLDPAMRTPEMANLERMMHNAGAIGGKAAGAGAGGTMFFVVRNLERARLAAAACGVRILPLRWATEGIILA